MISDIKSETVAAESGIKKHMHMKKKAISLRTSELTVCGKINGPMWSN